MLNKVVKCNNFEISNNKKISLISGPCQLETEQHAMDMAGKIKEIADKFNIGFIYKTSFDKANRTSLSGERGAGLEECLEGFEKIKKQLNVRTTTDIHESYQANLLKDHVDIIQIPAFLSRQTDLILSAINTGKTINIKKGQFMAPWDVSGILSKCSDAAEVWITERGVLYGYNNLVVDFSGMDYMINNFNVPIFFDVTHSVQKPSIDSDSSGGAVSYTHLTLPTKA